MKLNNHFFKILDTSEEKTGTSTTIVLNPEHVVYQGHFPGYPVTPGVIQLQVVHELLERQLGKKLALKNMSQCKFLKILNPKENPKITIHIETVEKPDLINAKAWAEDGGDVYFKLRANYQPT